MEVQAENIMQAENRFNSVAQAQHESKASDCHRMARPRWEPKQQLREKSMTFRMLGGLRLVALLMLMSLALLSLHGGAALAQTAEGAAVTLPEPLSPEAVREMVARMSDDQVRSMLLDRLDALSEAQTDAAPEALLLREKIVGAWTAFYTPILEAIARIPTLVVKQAGAVANFVGSFGVAGVLTLVGLTIAALVAGFAVERLFLKACAQWLPAPTPPTGASLSNTLGFLLRRFWREFVGLIVFYAVVRVIGQVALTPEQLAVAGPFVQKVVFLPRIAAAFARMVLAPDQPNLRLVSVNDHWARYFQRHIVGLVLLGGAAFFITGFSVRFGAALYETRIGYWLNLGIHIYIIWIMWHGRQGLTEMMLGSDPERSTTDREIAHYYPYFAVGVTAFIWVVSNLLAGYGLAYILQKGPHFTTMFWLLIAPIIDTAIRGLVWHLQPPMIGTGPVAEKAYRKNKRSLIRIGRVVALGAIVMIIANAWDIDLISVASDTNKETFISKIFEFIIVCAIGYIIFELVSLAINRRLTRETAAVATSDQEAGEGGGAGGSRLATVLPLILAAVQIAIAVVFGLLAIGSLGIDTTPLLAGAGILGLAIGFGAQKLVTDIVSGIFFLIDDAFRVGEYVDVGGTMGTVEKISIRSMQLRHHRGNVHTIPYGSIEKVTNFSRDWVIMKLMFTVPFDTDPNKVKKIFKKIGAEMMEDPLFKDDFLEPFKSQGVFQFDDVGIVMRGKFMAKPGTQFTIRKEIYNRVREEFKANGIEFARREVRVAIPGMEDHEDLNVEQRAAVEAAASGAVQAQLEQDAAAKSKK
jgi:small-conductance mechanosensitive channel